MNYRELGKSGLSVSEVGLGGEYCRDVPAHQVHAVIDAAMDGGINILDVFMPEPEVRSALGDALKGRRDKMILQGHVGSVCENGQYSRVRDLKRSQSHIEDFLQRFHTDYIDIGMLHYVDELEDWKKAQDNGLLEYMQQQKDKGVFRVLGVSSHNALVAQEMIKTGIFDVLMFSISPLFDLVVRDINDFFNHKEGDQVPPHLSIDSDRAALYALCQEKGVGITVMKSLAGGSLLRAESSPFGMAMTVPQCIQYALDRPAVSSVLVGCKSAEEMNQALAYNGMSPENTAYSGVLSRIAQGGQKKCMYCNHCLPCPVNVDIAAVTRLADEVSEGANPQALRSRWEALAVKPSACIQCGACARRCPFAIDAPGNMKRAAELWK